MTPAILLISDFNIELLARFLRNRLEPGASVCVVPYNQVYQALEGVAAEGQGDWAFVWARAESVLPSVGAALQFGEVEHERCLEEVDTYAAFLARFATRFRSCLVAAWTLPPRRRGYGLLDWKPQLGLSSLIARLNLRLAERLAAIPGVYLMDSARWVMAAPRPAAKMWFTAKVPYANAVFETAAADIGAAMATIRGNSRRLVVVDLDNTLWGGVIGETGWQGIRLGGHDYVGEAYVSFQRALKALSKRGVQLAVVSKNDERTALDAFDHHAEMVLRRSDLAGWRIDWNDKAANIMALVEDLNLGPASVVFIDDNPHERERVRNALPDVLVPEWPADPCQYADTLLALDCFDTSAVSEEDRQRTKMYVAERERRDSRGLVQSLADWLQSLHTTVTIRPLGSDNAARAAQLLNKTNQLNMATRRLTERELVEWAATPGQSVLTVSVADRFGDMGLCGIVSVRATGATAEIVDYLLSCRVMGRSVEETMIHLAVCEAARLGAAGLTARFVPTERNAPCLRVLRESRLEEREPLLFTWECSVPYERPPYVAVVADEACSQASA